MGYLSDMNEIKKNVKTKQKIIIIILSLSKI